jgi:hypothetical protein
MMKDKLQLPFLLIFFLILNSYAQNKTIKGTVLGFKDYALNNVVVKSKKSKKETLTDSLGNFTIQTKGKDELEFSADGFYPEKFKIHNSNDMVVNMIYVDDNNSYDDVLESKHLSQEVLDYCVAHLMEDNNNYDRLRNVFEIIQNVYPGANIEEIDGITRVVLNARGPNTIMAGNYALLVVDGIVVNDITNVQPLMVKSVKVLLGNNAGHWGVRGGNGVVEIVLKDGSK